MKGSLAALACTLLAVLACGRPEPHRATPLADLTHGAEILWPDGCQPPKSNTRPGDDLVPLFGELPAVRRLRLGREFQRDERVALLASPGVRYRLPFQVPEDAELSTAFGRLEAGGPLRLAVRILVPGENPVVVDQRDLAPGAPERWEELRLDLARWGGRSVVAELEATSAAEPAESCGAVWGGWSAPRIVPRVVAAETRPNVIWVSVDTLRADRLGIYGGHRPTSPELDRFASAGVKFDWAISQSPWTKPSHRSMLSGLYPSSKAGNKSPLVGVPLQHAGYRTFAMTGAGQVDSSFGFDRGFEIYRLHDWIHDPKEALDWVLDRTDRSPFFLFLHTYEAHEPYTHTGFAEGLPSGRLHGEYSKKIHNELRGHLTDEEKEYVRALYDGDIAYTDAHLGILFQELRDRGLLDNTIFLLTSDHGEQLWDHGSWGHGQSMHDHQIHVPLVFHLPGSLGFRAARSEDDQIELVDLYPTVLDFAGVPIDHEVQGRTLRPLFEGKGPLPPKPAFSEHTNIRTWEKRSLRTPRMKFVLWERRKAKGRQGDPVYELYDLRADPGELHDLYGKYPDRATVLMAEIRKRIEGGDGVLDEEVPANIDEELRKQLEALGYIGN